MNQNKINWLLNSRAYKKAKSLVDSTLASPQKLAELISKAQHKSAAAISPKFSKVSNSVNTLFRLLKAYASGEYRDISIESVVLIVASIIYFIMPIDVIPDFILVLGHADDAALLGWTIQAVSKDLDRFLDWEKGKSPDIAIEK